jgi:hypothetical protein
MVGVNSRALNKFGKYSQIIKKFVLHKRVKVYFFLISLSKQYPNKVNNISTRGISGYIENQNKFIILYSNTGTSYTTFKQVIKKIKIKTINPLSQEQKEKLLLLLQMTLSVYQNKLISM